MNIPIPPPPATAALAVSLANALAYGWAKHTDVAYWNRYPDDPEYFWKRLLGWQAGPEDAPRYGAYANPPSPWHVSGDVPGDPSDGDGGTDPVQVPNPPSPDSSDALAVTLRAILERLDAQDRDFTAFRAELAAYARSFPNLKFTGTVTKAGRVTLKVKI